MVAATHRRLIFALGCIALGILLAAGALFPAFGLRLSPMIAAAAMAASSLSVVTHANRLRRFSATPSRPPVPRQAPRPVVVDLEAPRVRTATGWDEIPYLAARGGSSDEFPLAHQKARRRFPGGRLPG